tara:strand:- start:333 stop:887 length:555 start_codon:yes stop_codon:yes gene_type:complete
VLITVARTIYCASNGFCKLILFETNFLGIVFIMGKIVAICISAKKGVQKKDIKRCKLLEGHGLEGDAHAGDWHRQISLLSKEGRKAMEDKGAKLDSGDFGENLLTEGVDYSGIEVGNELRLGKEALVRVTQIGKECHDKCNIYYQVGDCIMPREGIFAEVLKGGEIKVNDYIGFVNDKSSSSNN